MSRGGRLALDVGLLMAFLLAFNPKVTGISLHEWLSLAIAVPALVHLIVNWDWVVRVMSGVLSRVRRTSRLNLLVDALLFVSTVTVMLSGLLVSQVIAGALGLVSAPGAIWYAAHALSAQSTIALLVVHLALHGSWIANAMQVSLRRTAEVTS